MKLRHLVLSVLLGCAAAANALAKQPVDYVDMFIGTSNSRWMLGPYAQLPFGMVQLGPDNQGDVWMGGYEYSIHNVSGFSHLHAWTMGGLTVMPSTGDLTVVNPSADSPYRGANAGYHSRILKQTETASPGYYSVFLYDAGVRAELIGGELSEEELAQVRFELLSPDGQSVSLTMQDGVFYAGGLASGTYVLRQTQIPQGYTLAAERTVSVSGGEVSTLTRISLLNGISYIHCSVTSWEHHQ